MLERPRRRDLPAQQPRTARTRSGTAAAEMQQQIIDKKLKVYVIDAYGSPSEPAWAGASTPSCRPASSRSPASCRATRRSPSRTRSRRPTARRARSRRRRTSPRSTRTLDEPARGQVPGEVDQRHRDAARSVPRGARVRQKVTADDDGRQGRPAAGQRHARSTAPSPPAPPVGEAQHRAGDPGLGSRTSASSAASARWSARTRRSA
jgi:hypothetical protein